MLIELYKHVSYESYYAVNCCRVQTSFGARPHRDSNLSLAEYHGVPMVLYAVTVTECVLSDPGGQSCRHFG